MELYVAWQLADCVACGQDKSNIPLMCAWIYFFTFQCMHGKRRMGRISQGVKKKKKKLPPPFLAVACGPRFFISMDSKKHLKWNIWHFLEMLYLLHFQLGKQSIGSVYEVNISPNRNLGRWCNFYHIQMVQPDVAHDKIIFPWWASTTDTKISGLCKSNVW